MLEVIVLGQIPGTSIQITFFQVSVFALSSALLLILARDFRRYSKNKSRDQEINSVTL